MKKPRRSQRISSKSQTTPLINDNAQLPSPMTHQESTMTEEYREGTISPPEGRSSQIRPRTPASSSPPPQGLSSPPADTQVLSQFVFPMQGLSYDVEDEEAEGVWGYLLPLDRKLGDTLVLRRRTACPAPTPGDDFGKGTARRGCGLSASRSYGEEEEQYEENKRTKGFPAGGYLVGRHPECGMFEVIVLRREPDSFQTVLFSYLLFRIDTVYFSLRTKVENPLLWWKISRVMELL